MVYGSSGFSRFLLGLLVLFPGFFGLRGLNQCLDSLKLKKKFKLRFWQWTIIKFTWYKKVNIRIHPLGFPWDLDGRSPSFSLGRCRQCKFQVYQNKAASLSNFFPIKPPYTGGNSTTCRPQDNPALGPFFKAPTSRKALKVRSQEAKYISELSLPEFPQKLLNLSCKPSLEKTDKVNQRAFEKHWKEVALSTQAQKLCGACVNYGADPIRLLTQARPWVWVL